MARCGFHAIIPSIMAVAWLVSSLSAVSGEMSLTMEEQCFIKYCSMNPGILGACAIDRTAPGCRDEVEGVLYCRKHYQDIGLHEGRHELPPCLAGHALRGSNTTRHATEVGDQPKLNKRKNETWETRGHRGRTVVRLVLGWSTGHVGTSTCANASLYKLRPEPDHNVIFEHETMNLPHWKRVGHEEEEMWVQSTYLPHVRSRLRKGGVIFFDPGHRTLQYPYGILSPQSMHIAAYNITLVHIRRERIENAHSLMYKDAAKMWDNLCELQTGYCPFVRPDDIVTAIPSRAQWANLTPFQQALWCVDEVDARWIELQRRFPPTAHRHYAEFGPWTTRDPSSLERVIKGFAGLLGARRTRSEMPHAKPHRSEAERLEVVRLRESLEKADRAFLKMAESFKRPAGAGALATDDQANHSRAWPMNRARKEKRQRG